MATSEALWQVSQYLNTMQAYWWPFCRFFALFTIAPPFNHKSVSLNVRVLTALVLTIALGGSLPEPPLVDGLNLQAVLFTLEQILFGVLLGLALQFVFTIFTLIGETISTQMGMSMARFNDPMNGVSSSSILYQLYFILLIFLLLSMDGHLLAVNVLFQSFVYWPVGSGLHFLSMQSFLAAMAWVFSAAVLITLPVVFCMTLVQFSFGLLNRISPAMNLFSLGFPTTIMVGLVCIYLTLPNMAEGYLTLSRTLLDSIGVILREGHRV